MNPHSARSNPKTQAQRNITPNFLRFKRISIFIQASPSPGNKKMKVLTVMALKGVTQNPTADVRSKSLRKEFCISALSVLFGLLREKPGT